MTHGTWTIHCPYFDTYSFWIRDGMSCKTQSFLLVIHLYVNVFYTTDWIVPIPDTLVYLPLSQGPTPKSLVELLLLRIPVSMDLLLTPVPLYSTFGPLFFLVFDRILGSFRTLPTVHKLHTTTHISTPPFGSSCIWYEYLGRLLKLGWSRVT